MMCISAGKMDTLPKELYRELHKYSNVDIYAVKSCNKYLYECIEVDPISRNVAIGYTILNCNKKRFRNFSKVGYPFGAIHFALYGYLRDYHCEKFKNDPLRQLILSAISSENI